MSFARRISHLKPEGAYAVLARAQELEAQGREIIHLEIGQPDFETYSHISLAGIRAIASGQTRYNPPAGIPALRRALAEDAGRRRGVPVAPEQVVVAPGAKPLLFLPMLALLQPGDEVLYPDPGFPAYEAAIGVAGAAAVPVPLLEERGFDLDLETFDARIGPQTRMIVLNSPSNPTGGIHSRRTLEHVAAAARHYDCWVLSDEIYSRLVYEEDAGSHPHTSEGVGRHPHAGEDVGQHPHAGEVLSILSLPGMVERTIVADGFSKTYAMTGWRIGYGIVPQPLAEKLGLLLTHSVGCTASFTQYAGLEAVLGPQDQVDAVRAQFRRRRDVIVEGLNAIAGVRCPMPRGAFYAFPNVEAFGRPVEKLAETLLEEAGVALLPGTAFGSNGRGHLRLSYANSVENIEKALERMARALETTS